MGHPVAFTSQLDRLYACTTIEALTAEYDSACSRYAADSCAMWAINEATRYVHQTLRPPYLPIDYEYDDEPRRPS